MNRLYYLLLVFFAFNSCNKNNVKGDLSGKEYIRGRLFLTDTLTQHVIGTPLANKTLTISYADNADTLNYLFSIKTDDQGYFVFQNLKPDKLYRIFYEEEINGIYYSGRVNSNASVDSLRLTASLALKKQNGIYYSVTDPSGGPVKGAKLCVFANTSAYQSGNCDLANYPLTSNEAGQAFKIDVLKGTYFVLGSFTINNTNYTFKDTIQVADTIVFKKMSLKENKTAGFSLSAVDIKGYAIGGVTYCVFTSPVLFKDTCDGSNFQMAAGIDGKAEKAGLQAGRYYIYGHFEQGNTIYSSLDTIDLDHSMVKDTLIFTKKY